VAITKTEVKHRRHKRDLYLRREHGITLYEYNEMDRKQHYRCKLCKRPPKNLPLAVDHWHWLARRKVVSSKRGKCWVAEVPELWKVGIKIRETHKIRKKAIKAAKLYLRRLSVRGLLCWACNTGLRKYFDNSRALFRAAKYMKNHQKQFRKIMEREL
jgi:hypothetical protein